MAIKLYELVGADAERPFSPHCWKTAWSLGHKGLEFETAPTPFTAVPSVEGGVSKTVPVIRDGDKVVADSFQIALYLEEAYPDGPTLFGGEGGKALSRFIERWSQLTLHPYIGKAVLMDIHGCLAQSDQEYFRADREVRFGRTLEEVPRGRDEQLDRFRKSLAPLRSMLEFQPFIGGAGPLFADYIVAGALQWPRVVSSYALLEADDPVAEWFGRILDLHDGLGRRVAAAA
ncbi:MAG: glutathione S-transferase family protein [Rhizobiaceae bacterium]